ncbi:MAG: hypothetical protein LBD01_01655 [Puniceicoccales bacterium]|jgi:hypothetical protein|nr:hypothetical protein [Puniceicoccales bacterium]
MSKTLSLIIRIVAILGAIASGAAFYYINEQNIKVAMVNTEWYTSDLELKDDFKADKTFVKRMGVQAKIKALLTAKRAEIEKLTRELAQERETVDQRNKTIQEKDGVIANLESEKADLIRRRNELTASLQQANSKANELQAALEEAQRTITQKNEEIQTMFPKEVHEMEIKRREAAEDKYQRSVSDYTRLWRWAEGQTGFKPPHPVVPGIEAVKSDIPAVKEAAPRIPTRIIAVDLRWGVITVSAGLDNSNLQPGQTYDLEMADGNVVGKLRVAEIRSAYTVLSILPGSKRRQLVKDLVVNLVRTPSVSTAQPSAPVPVVVEGTRPEAAAAPAAAPAAPLTLEPLP